MVGDPGGGGEYIVQEGFGWTNGVILSLLQQFGDKLKAPGKCPRFPNERPAHKVFTKSDLGLWRAMKQPLDIKNAPQIIIFERKEIIGGSLSLIIVFLITLSFILYFSLKRRALKSRMKK
jgi:hypothetical protein